MVMQHIVFLFVLWSDTVTRVIPITKMLLQLTKVNVRKRSLVIIIICVCIMCSACSCKYNNRSLLATNTIRSFVVLFFIIRHPFRINDISKKISRSTRAAATWFRGLALFSNLLFRNEPLHPIYRKQFITNNYTHPRISLMKCRVIVITKWPYNLYNDVRV